MNDLIIILACGLGASTIFMCMLYGICLIFSDDDEK